MRRKAGNSKRIKRNNRKKYKLVVLVCEGEETEVLYFRNFRSRNNGVRIAIPSTKCTDPKNLLKFAISLIDELELVLTDGDHIWCIFDVDNNDDKVLSWVEEKAKKHKVNIAISNPSFELWYLLHFTRSTSPIDSNNDLIKRLKVYINNYEKNKCVYEKLRPLTQNAIKNAQTLIEHHNCSGNILNRVCCNPSTQVFEVVEFLNSINESS